MQTYFFFLSSKLNNFSSELKTKSDNNKIRPAALHIQFNLKFVHNFVFQIKPAKKQNSLLLFRE